MRKKIVAGNWKMNKDLGDGATLIEEILSGLGAKTLAEDQKVICIPPFIHLQKANNLLKNKPLELGAQNVHEEESGAYTGEVSAEMLKSVGASYCLVGHSERRTYQNETDTQLISKVKNLLTNGIVPIFCIGETLEQREAGQEFDIVRSQIEVLFELKSEEFSNIIIAYEPVWAIGTGKTASSDQAQEIHAYIRKVIADQYGSDLANELSILYGGSCKPDNAADLFSKEDVDGGLIGGASLDANSFMGIIKEL